MALQIIGIIEMKFEGDRILHTLDLIISDSVQGMFDGSCSVT